MVRVKGKACLNIFISNPLVFLGMIVPFFLFIIINKYINDEASDNKYTKNIIIILEIISEFLNINRNIVINISLVRDSITLEI